MKVLSRGSEEGLNGPAVIEAPSHVEIENGRQVLASFLKKQCFNRQEPLDGALEGYRGQRDGGLGAFECFLPNFTPQARQCPV